MGLAEKCANLMTVRITKGQKVLSRDEIFFLEIREGCCIFSQEVLKMTNSMGSVKGEIVSSFFCQCLFPDYQKMI